MIVSVVGTGPRSRVAASLAAARDGLLISDSGVPAPGLSEVLAGERRLDRVISTDDGQTHLPLGWGLDRPRWLVELPSVLEAIYRRWPHAVFACPSGPWTTRNAVVFAADAVVIVSPASNRDDLATWRDVAVSLETPIAGAILVGESESAHRSDPGLPLTVTRSEGLTEAVDHLADEVEATRGLTRGPRGP